MAAPREDKPIVVVGAGSTGSSTAYHLANRGHNVVLLDKGEVASGMTSRSTALVRTHYSNEIVAKMALYSLRSLENFVGIGDSGFVNNGMLILVGKDAKSAILENVAMLNRIGVKNEILEKNEAIKRYPELNLDDCDFILLEPQSGFADPVGTANSFAAKARQLGAKVFTGTTVEKIEKEGKRVNSIALSDGNKIVCSKVIICTNVWTNRLLSNSGVTDKALLPMWAAAHPVMILKRPKGYLGIRPSIADFPNKTYYKPEGQSLFFAGSLDADLDKQKIDPENCPNDVPFEFMNFYSEAIAKRIPLMKEGVVHSSFIGMYDMTPDQHPIMDELGKLGLEGAYCCVGLSGHGFKLCPALGLMNTEMIEGRTGPEQTFDRSYFSLDRFETGRLLTTRYSDIGTVA